MASWQRGIYIAKAIPLAILKRIKVANPNRLAILIAQRHVKLQALSIKIAKKGLIWRIGRS